jgi:hypothetical protein
MVGTSAFRATAALGHPTAVLPRGMTSQSLRPLVEADIAFLRIVITLFRRHAPMPRLTASHHGQTPLMRS